MLRYFTATNSKNFVHIPCFSHDVVLCREGFRGSTLVITDKLQRVLNTAACVVTGIQKFDRFMRRCLDETASRYLATHYTLVSVPASRHYLRSAASHQFVVLSHRLSSYVHTISVFD